MERTSFRRILMALTITSLYIFMFGIMGVIEPIYSQTDVSSQSPADTSDASGDGDEPGETEETEPAPETASATIDVSNGVKPGLADYDAPVLNSPPDGDGEPVAEQTEATTTQSTSGSGDSFDDDSDLSESGNNTSSTSSTAASTETSPDSSSSSQSTASGSSSSDTLSVVSNGSLVEGNASDIVARVVQHEVGSSFDKEAIKAQAVAAYTYIKRQNNLGSSPNVGLATTASDRVKECVADVEGVGIYYNNELIQSVYCASSAGYTSSALNVWGEDLPYLRSVKCSSDERYDPNFGKTATFSSSEIAITVLKQTGIDLTGDPGGWFNILSYTDTVYVGEMSIGGKTSYSSGGEKVKITGRVFREKIMNFDLRSAAFSVDYDKDKDLFTFTTDGYGHGAGMSQNGANILATYHSYGYVDILKHYYLGVEVR